MKSVATLFAALAMLGGCKSAEEECNEARVASYDAWATYVSLIEADAADAATALAEADTVARPARDEACGSAWLTYGQTLAAPSTEPGRSFTHSPEAFAIGAILVFSMGRTTTPCPDPRSADAQRQEQREQAAGNLPDGVLAARDAALRGARDEYERATGSLRRRRDWARAQVPAAMGARSVANGGAIVARDASRNVEMDPSHPEFAAAQAAGEASWEACQSVDP